jgi:RNA polymerase sigma-70 factor (ECF subfamily)
MLRTRSKATFDELYEKHHRMVRYVLYNLVGEGPLEDLAQEAFLRIWKGLPAFAFQSTPKTWIYRITVNVAMDHFRKHRVKTESLLESMPIAAPETAHPNRECVRRALATLSDDHRTVAVLFYFEELTLKEIAGVLDVAEGTVKSRLHFAREHLRAFLEREGMNDVA